MPSQTLPTPSPEELEDLIYYSRTSDLPSLKSLLAHLCATHLCAPSIILASSIDIDADGLGSQNSLLHYPAANGDIPTLKYLLSLLSPSEAAGDVGGTTADKSAPAMVNHRNVNGNTPLHWAAVNGHLEVVQVLVGAGADPGVRNERGRDVLVEAEMGVKEGCRGVGEWLERNWKGLERGVGNSGGAETGETVGDVDEDEVQKMQEEVGGESANGGLGREGAKKGEEERPQG